MDVDQNPHPVRAHSQLVSVGTGDEARTPREKVLVQQTLVRIHAAARGKVATRVGGVGPRGDAAGEGTRDAVHDCPGDALIRLERCPACCPRRLLIRETKLGPRRRLAHPYRSGQHCRRNSGGTRPLERVIDHGPPARLSATTPDARRRRW